MSLPALVRRWWFWVGFVVTVVGAWYVYGWAQYEMGIAAKYGGENAAAREYFRSLQKREAAYKKDTYGGETPEETLRMFVEALEAKDFELAAKYFVIEEQKSALRENRLGDEGGGNTDFIAAYRNGRVLPPGGVGASGIYEIEVFPAGESVAYGVRLIQNEFTGKWKILEL